MAGEILYAGIADQVTAEALSGKYILLLADRNAIPAHPAIAAGYQGDVAGRGSNTIKVPHIGLFGYDQLAAGTEGTATGNTALTDGSSTITVGQRDKIYEASDMTRMVDANGLIKPDTMAVDAVVSAGATMLSMLANLVDGFSAQVGTSGADATAANFLDLITTLEVAGVVGPYLFVGHPTQWGDIRKDVGTAIGGAIQWNAGSQAILDGMKGLGYQGNYLGADVFTTKHVPTINAGADRGGGMFGAGAIVWADGTIPTDADPNQLIIADKLLFERVRAGKAGLTAWLSRMMIGMSVGLDAAGATLQSDA